MEVAGPLGTPLGLAQRKRASPRGEAAMRETWVQPLAWEDPLEEGMATHSSTLAWRILMDSGTWWATVNGVTKSWT